MRVIEAQRSQKIKKDTKRERIVPISLWMKGKIGSLRTHVQEEKGIWAPVARVVTHKGRTGGGVIVTLGLR